MKRLFLCTCNNTLNKTLDFSRVEKEIAKSFDSIEKVDSLCLEEGLVKLQQSVSDGDLVVIGACSSQIIDIPVKQKLSGNHISFVPLREHVAWVHPTDGKSATNKAVVLLADAAEHLDHMELPTEFNENMIERVLIIGGGIAGLKAASDLQRLRVGVTLLEPLGQSDEKYYEDHLFMSDGDTLTQTLKSLQKDLSRTERIQGHVEKIEGQMGSYEITWKDSEGKQTTQDYGAVIVATGTQQYLPNIAKKCRFGKSERVLTLQDLIRDTGKRGAKKSSNILVVTDPDVELSSAEGSHLLRMTYLLASKGNTVFVTHSDIRTDDENLYRKARDSGVVFLRGTVKQVKEHKDGLTCFIENRLESLVREVTVEIVAINQIAGPVSETARLATTLGLVCDEKGFIKTRYAKMKPVQTSQRGIFVAGGSKTPMNLSDALTSAQNAVLEVYKVVKAPLKRAGLIPVIDDETCDACKACITACPNDALRMFEDKVIHIPVHCEFCGICVSSCPTRAIEFQSHSKESWFARLETIAKTHSRLERNKPFTLVYACSECANASIDQAGFTGKVYPTGTYVLQFPCAGMVSPIEILKGLVVGAERVIVAHCPPGGCHHQTGDHHSELVVQLTREMLREIGQDPDRVQATYMIAAMPEKMQKEVGLHG